MVSSHPRYLEALSDGSLRAKVEEAQEALRDCRLCPRDCGANRSSGESGFCRTGRLARVASFGPHLGEESCLSGWRGSGTIFFSWCNLRCVFCQNHDLSQAPAGREMSAGEISEAMLELAERGCHNVNLVTPGHVIPQVLEALLLAAERGLRIPVVYNSNGYDGPKGLSLLDGVVDIYMPDFKAWEPSTSYRFLKARDYPEAARRAILEMHRQVGPLEIGRDGLARRGVLVRHLVMPGLLSESTAIFRFLSEEVSPETFVNIMGQYRPAHLAALYPPLERPIAAAEMREAFGSAVAAGLHRFDR